MADNKDRPREGATFHQKVHAGRDVIGRDQINIYLKEKEFLFAGVPVRPNVIVGRDEDLAQCVEDLTSGKNLSLSAEGLPGVGKTTLAAALAYDRELLQHFENGVLWAGLGRNADARLHLLAWGTALGQDLSGIIELADLAAAVKHLIGSKKILIIIDDAWELPPAEALKVGGPNCVHLLTTRDKDIAEQFSGKGSRAVEVLEEDQALALLMEMAGTAVSENSEEALKLVRATGGLPLSLKLIGRYLNAPQRRVRRSLIQKALARLSDPAERLALSEKRLGSNVEQTLHEVISLSLEALEDAEGGGEARKAFYCLGAFAPKPETFSWEAAQAVAKVDEEAIALLYQRNLLEADEESERLAMHQSLSDAARQELPTEAVKRHASYYIDLVNRDREDWRTIEVAWPQIQWAWECTPDGAEVYEWIWGLNFFMGRRGLRDDEIVWIERGLRIAVKYPELRTYQGTLLNNIGLVYHNLGQREKALEYYNQALPIMKEIGDRSGLAATLNNIGLVYRAIGQPDKALEYYNQVLPIREEVGDRSGLAITLNNIGLVYDNLEQWEKALQYYNQALSIREEVGDRSGLAVSLNNIGEVYRAIGQPDKALEYYNRALPIREEVGDRPGLAATLNNIGMVYLNLGQRENALEYYNQALPIMKEVGDRYGASITHFNTAMIYRAQRDLKRAVAHLRKTVELDRLVQHPDLESDTAMLAQVEQEQAEQEKAG